jgi:hypothetical protein
MRTVIPVAYRFVERARQKFVHAEENYLRSHGWTRAQVGDQWLWERPHVPPGSVMMQRSDAVYFQHTKLGDDQ